jgi:hypothetical protein
MQEPIGPQVPLTNVVHPSGHFRITSTQCFSKHVLASSPHWQQTVPCGSGGTGIVGGGLQFAKHVQSRGPGFSAVGPAPKQRPIVVVPSAQMNGQDPEQFGSSSHAPGVGVGSDPQLAMHAHGRLSA